MRVALILNKAVLLCRLKKFAKDAMVRLHLIFENVVSGSCALATSMKNTEELVIFFGAAQSLDYEQGEFNANLSEIPGWRFEITFKELLFLFEVLFYARTKKSFFAIKVVADEAKIDSGLFGNLSDRRRFEPFVCKKGSCSSDQESS